MRGAVTLLRRFCQYRGQPEVGPLRAGLNGCMQSCLVTELQPDIWSRRVWSDRLLQLLRRPEGDLLAGLDLDLLAGCRVAPQPGFARANLEDAEAVDPDLGPLGQVLGEGLDELAQYGLDLPLRHVVALGQPGRQLLQADGRCRGRLCRCPFGLRR